MLESVAIESDSATNWRLLTIFLPGCHSFGMGGITRGWGSPPLAGSAASNSWIYCLDASSFRLGLVLSSSSSSKEAEGFGFEEEVFDGREKDIFMVRFYFDTERTLRYTEPTGCVIFLVLIEVIRFGNIGFCF